MKPLYKHKISKDRRKKWRWTLFAMNGKKVACQGQGVVKRSHAVAMVMKLFGPVLVLVLLVACAVTPGPIVSPQPGAVLVARTVAQTVTPASATCVLTPRGDRAVAALTASSGSHQAFTLPGDLPVWGADVDCTADGYLPYHRFDTIPTTDTEWPAITLDRAQPPLSTLHLAGRHGLVDEAGAKVPWTAVTGFRLVELVAHGRSDEAGAFLESITPARGARVLLMAANLFRLTPDEGLAALPAALDLAAQHGRYLEVTVFADTKSYPDINYRAVADQVGAICAEHRSAFALVEVANEVWPLHDTQAEALGDLAFLRSLREQIRAKCQDVPVSLGSTHADQDESDRMRDGDYLTIHGNRGAGDDGDWRWVRHSNEQRALADGVGRYAVNDEPRRDDLACDKQVGMALLTRLFSLGDTFHSAAGLQAQPLSGAEAQAFACRARGWAAVPDDWQGVYSNAGFAGGPVKSFDGAVRVYSSVNGGRAYTLVLGATGSLRIDWTDAWPTRQLMLSEGGAQLWSVSR